MQHCTILYSRFPFLMSQSHTHEQCGLERDSSIWSNLYFVAYIHYSIGLASVGFGSIFSSNFCKIELNGLGIGTKLDYSIPIFWIKFI